MAELAAKERENSCCSTAEQQTCCEPEDKSACCGEGSGACGCSAGRKSADADDGEDVRESVRDRYAAAAVAASSGSVACCDHAAAITEQQKEAFGVGLYESADRDGLPEAASWHRWVAATRLRSPRFTKARPSWILARAAVLTSFSRRGAWGRPARRSAWT